jgi:FecR protein
MPKKSFRLVLTAMACTLLALPALADSQIRIVRLSDVEGSVQIDKNTGLGFERAFLNLPITQGTRLQTRDNARAEIEFEDGSTLRLAPNTRVDFSTLSVNDSGKHLSVVNLTDGMAYVNWLGKSGDIFAVNFSRQKIELTSAAHFRIESSPSLSQVAVFKGDVNVAGPSENVTVEKKKMATFDDNQDGKYKLAKVEEAPLDSWDKEAAEYHQQYSRNNSTPYGYGFSDLSYYGAFSNVPGYGMMWQPFLTGAGWDPFMDGAWSFYPGMGYMFVSAYPWGWMPYLYGNWMSVPGFGWMWQPGYWNSYSTIPRYTNTGAGNVHRLVAPTGSIRAVAVGRGPTLGTTSLLTSRMVVSRGSAGLGIPRGSLSDLKRVNSQVAKSGSAAIHPAPQFATTSTARSMNGFFGTAAERGYGAERAGGENGGRAAGHSMGGGHVGGAAAAGGGHH